MHIEVDHQEFPAVHDSLEAMNSNAPIAHESLRSYVNLHVWLTDIPNIHSYVEISKPDSTSDEFSIRFEPTFTTPRIRQG